VIENAALRRRRWGRRYDVDAVDWLLGQFLLRLGDFELAGIGADPWGDLAVARLDLGGVSGPAKLCAPGKPSRGASRGYRAEQCENAWRDFGQLPGTHLCWGSAGGRKELRTAGEETLVSARRGTFSAGGRSFTFKGRYAISTLPPGVAELFARAARDDRGQFAARSRRDNRFEERFGRPISLGQEGYAKPWLLLAGGSLSGIAQKAGDTLHQVIGNGFSER
jgi:hypothetical protein